MTQTVEYRSHAGPSARVEARSSGEPRDRWLRRRVQQLSRNLGGYCEVVDERAFNRSKGNGWPAVTGRYNHRDLLATSKDGTLELRVDRTGLHYELEPPRSAIGDHVYELVSRGDVSESSFAIVAIEDDWSVTAQHYPLRRLLNVKLVDVSAVESAAYVDSSAGLRSLSERFGAPIGCLGDETGEGAELLAAGEP